MENLNGLTIKRCLVCGTENGECLCAKCKDCTDIEDLCNKIIAYTPLILDNPDANPLWDEIAKQIECSQKFQDVVLELAEYLPSPRKEYQKIHSMVGEYSSVTKHKKESFIKEYEKCVDDKGLSAYENLRLKGLMLSLFYRNYEYFKADEIASQIADAQIMPWQTTSSLAEFYIITRRYDEAESLLNAAKETANGEATEINRYQKLEEDLIRYRKNAENGKKEYMPNSKEDREKAINNYISFIASLGIDVNKPAKVPKPIPVEDYPDPVIIDTPDFDTFVAYDFETTGLSSSRDCIIEIGAVKVVNGVVTESEEFIFNEFVRPFKKSLTGKVVSLTGITQKDVKDARPMWEVVPDFMKFVGDNVLVGYNNATFDSKFLARAGRYSHIVIRNPQFDVLRYVRKMKKCGELDAENTKLGTISEQFGIENPAAHRAWADALTTAKIYMKLRNN